MKEGVLNQKITARHRIATRWPLVLQDAVSRASEKDFDTRALLFVTHGSRRDNDHTDAWKLNRKPHPEIGTDIEESMPGGAFSGTQTAATRSLPHGRQC